MRQTGPKINRLGVDDGITSSLSADGYGWPSTAPATTMKATEEGEEEDEEEGRRKSWEWKGGAGSVGGKRQGGRLGRNKGGRYYLKRTRGNQIKMNEEG